MRPISASIIVLAAVILTLGGLQVRGDLQTAVLFVAGVMGLFGLVAWFISFREDEK
jgi:hypothetical protein